MKRNVVLAVVSVVALAVVGVVALLSGGSGGAGGSAEAVAKRGSGAGALPTFSADMPAGERAPQTLQATPVVEMEASKPGLASGAPAARPAGPVRPVSGRVVRASDGTPIEGVRVAVHDAGPALPTDSAATQPGVPWLVLGQIDDKVAAKEPPGLVATDTDADGSFALDVPQAAERLALSTDRATQEVELPAGTEAVTSLEIVFDSGFRIGGRVLDETGLPLSGAHVDVERHVEAAADVSGRFVVKDVLPHDGQTMVKVRATAPGHVQATSEVLVPRDVTAQPEVELRLTGSGRLKGRVTHVDGSAVPQVSVRVGFRMGRSTDSQAAHDLEASTDDDGAWEIDHVPAGTYLVQAGGDSATIEAQVGSVLVTDGTGNRSSIPAGSTKVLRVAETWVPDVVVTTGTTTQVDIVLPSGALLAGHVLDPSGAPLSGARVVLERLARWPAPEADGNSITTSDGYSLMTKGGGGTGETVLRREVERRNADEHGRFEFGGLGAGEWHVLASLPGGDHAPADRTIVLRGDEQLASFDLLLSAGVVLRSRVTDPAGQPLAGAVIMLKDAPSNSFRRDDVAARSGDDGSFEVHGVTPARKAIAISLPGYTWVFTEVDPAAPPPAYVLQPAPKLRGEVVDALTGEPVEAFGLKVARGDGYSASDTQSRPGGTFTEEQGDDLPCDVTVSAPGYEPLTIKDVLPSTTTRTPLRFRLVKEN
ncbi:MAG TPA: carboxypeptidase-like regulatory domain-containing protein [Planctomycetota bacterium]|nr:carboxypeptidase-like regulatory domain-containing protein [Planctomycetota bacterium]